MRLGLALIVAPWLLLLVAVLTFSGCAEQVTLPPAHGARVAALKPQPVDLRPMCGTVLDYSQKQMDDLAAALAALPYASPIIPAMGDYNRMRDEARACRDFK